MANHSLINNYDKIMCGINGIIKFIDRQVVDSDIQRMNETIKHRGPDDDGVYTNGNVGLGHVRLSILDLSDRGHQPMVYSHNGRKVIIVYNGEIYNFSEVRSELSSKGYNFHSETDTEVVLASYLEYDKRCVLKFNGMFAFVIYDVEKNLIYGARDRFGQKPFKYYLDEYQFIFSSELKAILKNNIKKEPDFEAISNFLTLQYVPCPQTGFKGIYKLPQAHYFTLDIEKKSMRIERYYDLDFSNKLYLTEKEWIEKLDVQLVESVKKRLISDVPLGVFLSGGVDSSMIVAIMGKLTSNVKTFSIAFDEDEFDESIYARNVSKIVGSNHEEFRFRANDLLEYIKEIVCHYEEPYADNSQLPTFVLSKLTRKHVTVALGGDAGDENFGGYEKHRIHFLIHQLRVFLTPFVLLSPLIKIGRNNIKIKKLHLLISTLNQKISRRHYNYTTFFDELSKIDFFTEDFMNHLNSEATNVFDFILEGKKFHEIDKILYLDFNSYLPDDINVKVDMASMYNGLEVRSPMLDHDFVDLAAQIPIQLKTNRKEGKIIFKKLAEKYIPTEIIYRPKHGFGVPVKNWLRKELRALAHDAILDNRGIVFQMMKREKVENLLKRHIKGENHATKLWTLLVLNLWFKKYFL